MKSTIFLLAAVSLAGHLRCAALADADAGRPRPPRPPRRKARARRLARLFKESDEANLKRNPVNAIFRGDLRYADRLGDCITDEYYAAERAAGEADLAALHAHRPREARVRPTRSPTTCSNGRPRTRSRVSAATCWR